MQNRFRIYSAFAEKMRDSKWISYIDSWFNVNLRSSEYTKTSTFTRIRKRDSKVIVNSRKRYWIQSEIIMNLPSVSRIYNEFDIFFANSVLIYNVYRRLTLSSISYYTPRSQVIDRECYSPISRSVNRPMRHDRVRCYFISDHRLVQISQLIFCPL